MERQQLKWVMLGFSVACIVELASLAAQHLAGLTYGAPAFLIETIVQPLNYTVVALGLLVSLLRYRLYDAEVAITRSAAYAMLTVALIAVFTVTEKTVELLGQEYLGGALGTLAGGVCAAVMVSPLHRQIGYWSENRFHKSLIRLRRGLPALAGDMRETATLAELGAATLVRLEEGVNATRSAMLVDDRLVASRAADAGAVASWRSAGPLTGVGALVCVPEDPLFPVRVSLAADGVADQGWLLLGPRPDGSLYGKDERTVLADIAGPVARAIAIVRRREQIETDARTERGALTSRVVALETMVERLIGGDPGAAVARRT